MTGAYDTTWRYAVLLPVFNCGIRDALGSFICNVLSERFFCVRVGSQFSDRFLQENGAPQGGALSVAFFALAINNVVGVFPQTIGRSLFVDDFAIWRSCLPRRLFERPSPSVWSGDSFGIIRSLPGVFFDSRLTYREHAKSLRLKCTNALNILKCVARMCYGAGRAILFLLYRFLIRSKLD